jgi:hypothetical protein
MTTLADDFDGAMRDLETILLSGTVLGIPRCASFMRRHKETFTRVRELINGADASDAEQEYLERALGQRV